MKFKLEKNLKIINQIITFYYNNGATDIKIDFSYNDSQSKYNFSAKTLALTTNEIEFLSNSLNSPRQHEVEEYFWNLDSSSIDDLELSLISMMIDDAKISYMDSILTIELLRNEIY